MAVFRVDAIGVALKELEISGYLVRRQLRDARGRITDTEYTIYEQPHTPLPGTACPDTEKPDMDFPDTDTPYPEKPAQLSKDQTSPEKRKTDEFMTDESNPVPSSPPRCLYSVQWKGKLSCDRGLTAWLSTGLNFAYPFITTL